MALRHTRQSEGGAFTLVEPLVVIGIMAVLATISVTGYSAASRGMADRGVIQSTASILRVAKQTCEIDRVPTKVLFFNRRLADGTSRDDAALYQGTAIAIKQAGRITIKPSQVGNLLVDEFADWNQSYPMTGSENTPGMRFFRMTRDDDSKDIDGCSTLVKPFVKHHELQEFMIQSDTEMSTWCSRHDRTGSGNRPQGARSSYVNNGNNYVWGFEASSSGSGGELSVSSWNVGDPYGVEIARIDLPKGYIFGSSAPSDDKLSAATIKEVFFKPEEFEPKPNPGTVPIYAMRPSGRVFTPKHVGDVKPNMLDDDTSN